MSKLLNKLYIGENGKAVEIGFPTLLPAPIISGGGVTEL